jgi:hypothetical protein
MADKAPKFIDIKSADETTPSSTSRPVIVTNRPVLGNDPMMNAGGDTTDTKPAQPMTRSAKTIKPVSADMVAKDKQEAPAAEAATEPVAADVPEAPAAAESETPAETPATEPEPAAKAEEEPDTAMPATRDAAAESQADEAKATAEAEAAEARQNELENLIASGKFTAPINAAHRKRSRMIAIVLCLVALLLAVAVADAAVDAGLVTVDGVPHTDLLKDK